VTLSPFGPLAWLLFGAIVLAMLAVDLGASPGQHVGFRAAALRCVVWIAIGLGFGLVVYTSAGSDAGLAYWAAYLLEQSLSIDNLFVFVLVFSYFGLPPSYQPRVLFWGILGALAMRGRVHRGRRGAAGALPLGHLPVRGPAPRVRRPIPARRRDRDCAGLLRHGSALGLSHHPGGATVA